MKKLNVAVVGVGILGTRHARVFSEQTDTQVVAVIDPNTQRAESAAQKLSAHAYGTLSDALKNEIIDVVSIATPDHLHYDSYMLAIAQGKHIFIEKPLASTIHEAHQMADAATHAFSNKQIVMVNFSQRFLPDYAWIKQQISAGMIGEVKMVNSLKWDTVYVPTEMLSWAAQSSPFYFMSSHDIDLTCWYLGEQAQPLEVTAQDIRGVLDARKVAVQDGMNVLIRFKHAIANFHSSWIHPNSYPIVADGSMQVIGMTGVISYNNRLRKADIYHAYGGQELTFTGPATANEVNGKLAGAFVTSLRHFVECVITGQEPLTSPRRTLITSVIQTAAAQSLKINDKVTL